MTVEEKIKELREQLNNHNYNYYVLDNATISDFDFDRTLKELEKLGFIEDLTLYGLDEITNWDSLSKLKNLRKLKFISCDVKSEVSKKSKPKRF